MPTKYTNRRKPLRAVILVPGPSIAYIPLTKGLFALIDAEDVEFVSAHSWCAIKSRHGYQAQCRMNKKAVSLHRHLMDYPDGLSVDHKSGDQLDNRRRCGQLRVATVTQNACNQRIRSDNKTGHKGVYYCPKTNASNPYCAEIWYRYKKVSVGYFPSAEAATAARNVWLEKIHGEFSRVA